MLGKWFDICAGQAQTWHSADGYIWGSSNTKRGSQSCRQRTQDRGQMVVLQPIRSGFEETMEWEETFILVWIATPTCPLFFYSRIQLRANSNSRHTAGTALITSNLLKSVLLGTDDMASCGHPLGSKLMTGHFEGNAGFPVTKGSSLKC